jgi:hypothetical protein
MRAAHRLQPIAQPQHIRSQCAEAPEFFVRLTLFTLPDEAGDHETFVDIEPTTTGIEHLHVDHPSG